MNIYDFIDNPFKAVKAGYRPSYLTCVSAVSGHWWTFCAYTAGIFVEFKDILDMTLAEIIKCLFKLIIAIAIVISFPVSVWFLAWIQYLNVQHTIKNLEEIDKLQ